MPRNLPEFDYVIASGRTAGGVLAARRPDQISGNINAPDHHDCGKAADIILDRPPLNPFDPRETT